MSPYSSLLIVGLLFTPHTISAPLPAPIPDDAQVPIPAGSHVADPADANTFATLNYHAPPENPRNRTCSAADTACVVGVSASVSTQKRSAGDASEPSEHDNTKRAGGVIEASQTAGVTQLTNNNSIVPKPNNTTTESTGSGSSNDGICSAADTECVVAKRAGGVVAAEQEAGVDHLNAANSVATTQNSTKPSSSSSGASSDGMCSAADTACVVGKRAADAEALDSRIQTLRDELQRLKEKRQAGSLVVPGVKPLPDTSSGSATVSTSGNATNTTSGAQSTQTNEFGRRVCAASDVECVTGHSGS